MIASATLYVTSTQRHRIVNWRFQVFTEKGKILDIFVNLKKKKIFVPFKITIETHIQSVKFQTFTI